MKYINKIQKIAVIIINSGNLYVIFYFDNGKAGKIKLLGNKVSIWRQRFTTVLTNPISVILAIAEVDTQKM